MIFEYMFGGAMLIVVLALIGFQHFERKDLYNRIMCRDFAEYQRGKPPDAQVRTAHERALEKWRGKDV